MNRSIITLQVERVEGAAAESVQDLLAVEEPLEIRIASGPNSDRLERSLAITMRTPGHDFHLAAGFLLTEGIVSSAAQIREIRYAAAGPNPRQNQNSVVVELAPEVEVDWQRLERHFYVTSSCGVCGRASIEALQTAGCPVLPRDGPVFEADIVHVLPATLRASQAVFSRTGGLHAAALFDSAGTLVSLREDVGRHNAVDKLAGAALLERRTPLSQSLILVSGRASFELVQKALMAGIPVLAAVGAPSSLAVETARRFHMTLLGFVRDGRFNIYSGGGRVGGRPAGVEAGAK